MQVQAFQIILYTDTFTLSLPRDYKFLHIGVLHGALYMWLLVDPSANQIPQEFLYITDNTDIDTDKYPIYLGTAICNGNLMVQHLFTKRYKIKE